MYHRKGISFHIGTFCTLKLAHLNGRASTSLCLFCHQPDGQVHLLSGCQFSLIQKVVTERHNIASRLIIKTLRQGELGGNIIFTGTGLLPV